MKLKVLFTAFVAILAILSVIGCSPEEESVAPSGEILTEINEDGFLKNVVPSEGGTVDLTFSTNCDWIAVYDSDFYVDIEPASGKLGENTITATFPKNTSIEWDRSCYIDIVSTDGVYMFSIGITQEKKALLQLSQTDISFEQQTTLQSVEIKSNKEFEIVVDEEAKSWLKAEVDPSQNEGNTSTLEISATTNESLDSRQGIIIVKSGNVEEQITVTQKGGVIFDTELSLNGEVIDKGLSDNDIWYCVSPKQNTYILKIKSNISWNCTLPSAGWITFDDTEFNGKDGELAFSLTQQASDELESRTVEFDFVCDNGNVQTIKFEQDGWGVTVYVHDGEKLSQKYAELEEGYIVTSIYVTGGTLDVGARSSVRSVSISGVEIVPNNFCSNCENLSSLSLGNGITKIGASAFQNCSEIISSISIPETVTYIGDRAFLCYRSYPRVTCYNPTPPTLGSDVFHDGRGMGILSVPLGSKPKYKANSSWSGQFDQIKEF